MKTLLPWLSLFLLSSCTNTLEPIHAVLPPTIHQADDEYRESVGKAEDSYVAAIAPKLGESNEVTLYLMSPTLLELSPVEREKWTGEEPFAWPSGSKNFHEILASRVLKGNEAERLGALVASELLTVSGRMGALCFNPMHGIEIRLKDGSSFRMAVCLHCDNLEFDLPMPGHVKFKAIEQSEFTKALFSLMPISPELEERYFGAKRERPVQAGQPARLSGG